MCLPSVDLFGESGLILEKTLAHYLSFQLILAPFGIFLELGFLFDPKFQLCESCKVKASVSVINILINLTYPFFSFL